MDEIYDPFGEEIDFSKKELNFLEQKELVEKISVSLEEDIKKYERMFENLGEIENEDLKKYVVYLKSFIRLEK